MQTVNDLMYSETKAAQHMFSTFEPTSKTPRGVANEIKRYLVKVYGLTDVHVWSPGRTKELGWGSGWTVCAEGGPYEWASTLTGYCKGLYQHPTVYGECYNSFILNLHER